MGRLGEDLKRGYESGLVENVNFLREPLDGGLRLIVMVKARQAVGKILFVGNTAVSSKDLRNKISLSPNQLWDDLKLSKARDEILQMYAKQGNPAVDVSY